MTDFKVVAFHPRHLEVMEIRELESAGALQLKDAYARIEKVAAASVQAGTFLLGGRILFCAGFQELWPGVFEMWMIPSVHLPGNVMRFGRTIRHYVDRVMIDFNAHRLQATTHDDPFHERWMEFLGFHREARMYKFTNDKKNMLLYARTI